MKSKKENKEQNFSFVDDNAPEELKFLEQLISYRLNVRFANDSTLKKPVPDFSKWSRKLSEFIKVNKLNEDEACLLLIAMSAHLQSDLFDNLIQASLQHAGDFQKIGGVRGKDFRGFLPTGETAVFLLADDDFEKKLMIQKNKRTLNQLKLKNQISMILMQLMM
mgnify:CR=1 FL=1